MPDDDLSPERKEALFNTILDIVRVHPTGISEYDLLRTLESQACPPFSNDAFRSSFDLFVAHFILFHLLYQLRDRLLEEKRGNLLIECTCIALERYHEVAETRIPAPRDPMREYYLDLKNLEQTTEEDVTTMLKDFWRRFAAWNERGDALKVLGLEEPVDMVTIRQRYHELALTHHPDRGGDKVKLQEINAAMEILKRSMG